MASSLSSSYDKLLQFSVMALVIELNLKQSPDPGSGIALDLNFCMMARLDSQMNFRFIYLSSSKITHSGFH